MELAYAELAALRRGTDVTTAEPPLTRTCPKCLSAMHRSYHDPGGCARAGCTKCHIGHRTDGCPGSAKAEHLLWTCTCGYADTTPCADADG